MPQLLLIISLYDMSNRRGFHQRDFYNQNAVTHTVAKFRGNLSMRKDTRIVVFLVAALLVVLGLALTVPQQTAMARRRPPRPTPTPRSSSAPLVAPEAIWPTEGALVEAHPTLRWTAVPGAVRYHLQASLVDNWSLSEPGYLFLAHPEAYNPNVFWRVQAIDANHVQGPWSPYYHFTVTTPYTVHDISSHGLEPWP
jgi:hypothetical protein